MIKPSEDLAKQHYEEHTGKPFFTGLVGFLSSGPVVSLPASAFKHSNLVCKAHQDKSKQDLIPSGEAFLMHTFLCASWGTNTKSGRQAVGVRSLL